MLQSGAGTAVLLVLQLAMGMLMTGLSAVAVAKYLGALLDKLV